MNNEEMKKSIRSLVIESLSAITEKIDVVLGERKIEVTPDKGLDFMLNFIAYLSLEIFFQSLRTYNSFFSFSEKEVENIFYCFINEILIYNFQSYMNKFVEDGISNKESSH